MSAVLPCAGQTRPTRLVRIIAANSVEQFVLAYQASMLPPTVDLADGTSAYGSAEAGPLIQPADLDSTSIQTYFAGV